MIVVDSSALIAVLSNEPDSARCARVLTANTLLVSAGTLAEVLIVAGQRGLEPSLRMLLTGLDLTPVEVDEDFAERVASAYARWGKGVHPARLNYGDCFSYALAELYDCPLLFVGDDFSQTDIVSALAISP